jgi:hypothetical protein
MAKPPDNHGVMGYDLLSTLQDQVQRYQYYATVPPMACPNDGTGLLSGPVTEPGILFCPFDGWQYPRDWNPDVHNGM